MWARWMPSWRSRRTTRSVAATPRSFTREPPRSAQTAIDGQTPRPIGIEHVINAATPDSTDVPAVVPSTPNCRSTGDRAPAVLCRTGATLMLAAPEVIPTFAAPGHQPCDGTFGFDAF